MVQIYLFAAEELCRCKEREKLPDKAIAKEADLPGRGAGGSGKQQHRGEASGLPGWDKLTRWQQEKVSRCRQEQARRLCLGGQLLLQYAAHAAQGGINKNEEKRGGEVIRMHRLTGQQLLSGIPSPLPLEIAAGPKGKPYIVNASWHFNLSHSGGYAALAYSDVPVGVDIQQTGPYRASLARRFFAPEEAEACEHLMFSEIQGRQEAAAELFYTLWCRKEAYGKLKGTGLTENVLKRNILEDTGVFFREYDQLPGYRICVCCEKG